MIEIWYGVLSFVLIVYVVILRGFPCDFYRADGELWAPKPPEQRRQLQLLEVLNMNEFERSSDN